MVRRLSGYLLLIVFLLFPSLSNAQSCGDTYYQGTARYGACPSNKGCLNGCSYSSSSVTKACSYNTLSAALGISPACTVYRGDTDCYFGTCDSVTFTRTCDTHSVAWLDNTGFVDNYTCRYCPYTSYIDQGCGGTSDGVTCTADQMRQRRTSATAPSVCQPQTRCNASASCPSNPKPTAPTLNTMTQTCAGSTPEISLTWNSNGTDVTYADLSTDAAFGSFYNKAIAAGVTTTTGPTGFNASPAGTPAMSALVVGTTYYARVFNGAESNVLNLTVNASCAPTPTNTPTPTPTGAPVTPFFKVKNTSFYKYGNLDLIYPATLTPFDADDTTSNDFNQDLYCSGVPCSSGGVVLSQGTTSLTNARISPTGWSRDSVSAGTFNASSFVAYAKSKKTYTAINTNLNGVTTANTTYLYTGDLTLTQSSFPTSTIPSGTVLLVEGNVTVGAVGQTTLNTTANTPFALIVTGTLTFADATTQVNGLYAASTVNFGTGAVPLKIVGNVVSGSSSAISRVRTSAPFNAPSLFVVFDPTHYVNLIDRISVVKSDYQQVQ